jgi:hypothetical protein
LSENITTKNEATILPPEASYDYWKHSYEIVDAKKHASQKNSGSNLKILLSLDKPNSDFRKKQLNGIEKVGYFPKNSINIYDGSVGVFKRRMIKKQNQLDAESH